MPMGSKYSVISSGHAYNLQALANSKFTYHLGLNPARVFGF
jgi:hypothetical protein